MAQHLLDMHTEGRPFSCSKCPKTFPCERYLKEHLTKVHGNLRFPCNQCGKVFKQLSGLRHHQKNTHSDEPRRTWNCDLCDKSFESQGGIMRHKAITHGEGKFYKCDECPFVHMSEKRLERHKANKHSCLECEFCFKKFASKAFLDRHGPVCKAKDENGAKLEPVCQICSKTFRDRVRA